MARHGALEGSTRGSSPAGSGGRFGRTVGASGARPGRRPSLEGDPRRVDLSATYAASSRHQAGRGSRPSFQRTERIRQARAAIRALWDAEVEHEAPDAAAIDAVNAVLREAPRVELVMGEDCCGIGHRHTADDPTGEALARLAEPFVAAVGAATTDRLRICANDDCRWAFEDTSHAGRRRWCDMTSCGNATKARRHRARKRREASVVAPAADGATSEAAGSSAAVGP